jgi:NAD(P)-dependent dehydrogenase (short-subunit alcohol dehydrogenase family)
MGAATCARLVADGHRVIGVDRHEADVVADLSTPEGRENAVLAVTQLADGALDGLVTFAGLGGTSTRPGRDVVAVNYVGTVALLDGLRPALAAGSAPAAVAIGSNSTTCQPGIPQAVIDACLDGDEDAALAAGEAAGAMRSYAATKTAVCWWVRRHAPTPEWIGAGITLNAVSPGFVTTPMTDEIRADPKIGPLLDQFTMPVGRPGRPEEIAAVVAFLLGPDARFLCGSILLADGGTEALLRPDAWPSPL